LKTYEGMFLLNSVESKRDMEAATGHVKDILKKHHAEPGTNYVWDERKLAYEIHQQKRGTYYLVYFQCPPENIAALRRDCELSEVITRQLILAWEHGMPAMPTEEELAKHRAELAAVGQPGFRT